MGKDTTESQPHMRIVQLTAENVKRLKAVEITPKGAVQIIAGRNAQGKTSVLDAIWMALEWKAAGKVTPRPIRDGEDEGKVVLDLGTLTVTRTWTAKGTILLVTNAEGVPQQRPQELLDSLVGMLSFDPLEFSQMGDKEQVGTLLSLVKLPFDPITLEAERQALYDKRRLVGQDHTRAKGSLESMPKPDPDLPAAEAPMKELLAEFQSASDELRDNQAARSSLATAQGVVDRVERELADAADRLDIFQKQVDKLNPDPDIESVKSRLTAAETTNAAIRAAQSYRIKKVETNGYKGQYDQLEADILALDARKRAALDAAEFPIGGLSFDNEGVTFNGVPFSQASSAERLKVSLALAMAMNPTLRVIRITDGSLLDSENMAMVAALAGQHDFQVWVERVDESDKSGVVIEDGKVK